MSNLIPKPIVDKNGKKTTVNVKADSGESATSRVKSIPTTPATVEPEPEYEWTPPEKVSFDDMKKRAADIHAEAKVRLEGRRWVISIELDVEEDDTLPERFNGTPAAKALSSYDTEYGNELRAYNRDYGTLPLEIIAEKYNRSYAEYDLAVEFTNDLLRSEGLRSLEKIVTQNVELTTERERDIFLAYTDRGGNRNVEGSEEVREAINAYTKANLADTDARIKKLEDEYYQEDY